MSNNKSSGSFLVAIWEDKSLVRVQGCATLNNSFLFREFIEETIRKGTTGFIIDLSLCKEMDSTFVGVLLGISQHEAGVQLTIVNVSEYLKKILKTLGLLSILEIRDSPCSLPDIPMETLEWQGHDARENAEMIQKAHQCLANFNENNHRLFKDFLEMIAAELDE